jgi:hypothetical protein
MDKAMLSVGCSGNLPARLRTALVNVQSIFNPSEKGCTSACFVVFQLI